MIGQVVNNYEIKSLLGEGGMGSVYLAVHPFMGRKAAIKVLRSEFASDRSQVERFMNEARAANAIRHPNIIDIIDVGRLPSGVPYLMMEYLEGQNLAERIHALGTVPLIPTLELAIQTASALSAAHSRDVTHRDLKPDNLVLIADPTRPGGEQVKVLDFGIAKLRGELSSISAKTQTGSVMGTPPYMSPEQCRGLTEEIDHRTDIYALGIIVYEALCGVPPFMSPAWGDIVLGHMSLPPPPPRTRNPLVPESVEALIMKALSKKREDRFGSMADMEAALRAARDGVATAPLSTGARAAAAMRPTTASRPTTTFRGATGEVSTASILDPRELEQAGIKPPPRIRWGAMAGVLALVAVGAVGTLAAGKFLSGRGSPAMPGDPPGKTSSSPAPSPPPSSPAPPAKVVLHLRSEPSAARVKDLQGRVLGTTPFDLTQNRGTGALEVRFEKEGFLATGMSVPLRDDFETTIRLERRQRNATRSDAVGPKGTRKAAPAPSPSVPKAAAHDSDIIERTTPPAPPPAREPPPPAPTPIPPNPVERRGPIEL